MAVDKTRNLQGWQHTQAKVWMQATLDLAPADKLEQARTDVVSASLFNIDTQSPLQPVPHNLLVVLQHFAIKQSC